MPEAKDQAAEGQKRWGHKALPGVPLLYEQMLRKCSGYVGHILKNMGLLIYFCKCLTHL